MILNQYLLALIYLGVSVWAYRFKKKFANKNAWFIRSAWNWPLLGWLWPVSWQGHLSFLIILVSIYIGIFLTNINNYNIGTNQILIQFFVTSLIVFPLYCFAYYKKSEGYLFENDKWFSILGGYENVSQKNKSNLNKFVKLFV